MTVNENLTRGIHVEPDGLAWYQRSDGRLEVLEAHLGRGGRPLYVPLAVLQPSTAAPLQDDAAAWRFVRGWMQIYGSVLVKRQVTP